MINLDQIEPSQTVKERAASAGIDLESLKLAEPERYMMLVSETLLTVSEELKDYASSVFYAALPQHRLFELKTPEGLQLKAFPPLSKAEEEKVFKALGTLLDHSKFLYKQAYFRTVTDALGEQRQFAVPVSIKDWQGQHNVLIGAFESEQVLRDWAEKNVLQAYDALLYKGSWFCDVFAGA